MRNANAAPEVTRRSLAHELRRRGFRPGTTGGALFDWSASADGLTAAEGLCDHCEHAGLRVTPYWRLRTGERAEYECVAYCPRCSWAYRMLA